MKPNLKPLSKNANAKWWRVWVAVWRDIGTKAFDKAYPISYRSNKKLTTLLGMVAMLGN